METKNNNPICLFDSGIGGLTVLKKLLDKFPNENYIYFADLARVPFGDKTKEEINEIVKEIMEWLVKFNPKAIIMACNTSSALVLEEYQSKSNIPVYGMIESCAKEIANSKHKKVSVWATKLVANSNAYKNAIQKINSSLSVEEIACPKLVPMIESLNPVNDEKDSVIQECLEMTSKDSETLVLGCTHYPHIKENIKQLRNIEIIDPADALIEDLRNYLTDGRDVSPNISTSTKPQISLYATAEIEKLEKFSKLYLCGDYKVSSVGLKKITA